MKNLKINVPDGYEIDRENSTFEEIVFKKVENKLPKTWIEGITQNKVKGFYVSAIGSVIPCVIENINDASTFPTFKEAEACVALSQLCVLRDIYNGEPLADWINWTDGEQVKYSGYFMREEFHLANVTHAREVLAFKTHELRDEFVKNFKDLIIKAKPLL